MDDLTVDEVRGYVQMGLAVMFAVVFVYMAIAGGKPLSIEDMLALLAVFGFGTNGIGIIRRTTVQRRNGDQRVDSG